uniref:Fanconi anemia group J protein n=1 Tax=Aceria tosichella TaxID=561515 RepID=A0A6G1SRM1_9ACAR
MDQPTTSNAIAVTQTSVSECEGVTISFPFKPYTVQQEIMENVVRSLRNKTNCLIESPTGTGKTISIMSAVLAWDKLSRSIGKPFTSDEQVEHNTKAPNRPNLTDRFTNVNCVALDSENNNNIYDNNNNNITNSATVDNVVDTTTVTATATNKNNDDDSNQNVETVERLSSSWPSSASSWTDAPPPSKRHKSCGDDCQDDSDGCITGDTALPIRPRIYFVTRTHDQLKQVIGEVNKTCYARDLKTTLLAGRNRLCIYDRVKSMQSGQNECCQRLVSNTINIRNQTAKQTVLPSKTEETCPYYHETRVMARKFSVPEITPGNRVRDIEDLVSFGRQQNCCPYYGVRVIQAKADITFCTYNHIIDRTIRNNLGLNLKDSIIIFDEAHNIEDTCRENTSLSTTLDHFLGLVTVLKSICNDFRAKLAATGEYRCDRLDVGVHSCHLCEPLSACSFFCSLFSKLVAIVRDLKTEPTKDRTPSQQGKEYPQEKVFNDCDMLRLFRTIGLDSALIDSANRHIEVLDAMMNCNMDTYFPKSSSRRTVDSVKYDAWCKYAQERVQASVAYEQISIMKQLLLCATLYYHNEGEFKTSFKMVLERYIETKRVPTHGNVRNLMSVGITSGKLVTRFSILCMNAAVAFKPIERLAWSVILASGTLAPVKNLISELDCKFDNICEGSHVIPDDRLFACVVGAGPEGVKFNGAYSNVKNANYYYELGRAVVDVCKIVSNGVICFVPSYSRMTIIMEAWKKNGYLHDIESSGKRVFRETSGMSWGDFRQVLCEYRQHAMGPGGAILIAVFRGKISEGTNFADSMARAVISIGIPYSNLSNPKVRLKMEYNNNNQTRQHNNRQSAGWDWYTCQAFRPLSQALGRCIRHSRDWGAIIILENRLVHSDMQDKLPSWIRRNLPVADYNNFKNRLSSFVARLNDAKN